VLPTSPHDSWIRQEGGFFKSVMYGPTHFSFHTVGYLLVWLIEYNGCLPVIQTGENSLNVSPLRASA
jgi:hypothetical protein